MTYDNTTAANLALGHIGVGVAIGDLDTENSAEANAARRYFTHCRDVIYRMRRWSFASRLVTLTDLGVTGTNYSDVWGYRYMYPTDAMRINKITNPYLRDETTAAQKIQFEIAYKDTDTAGKVILCDQECAAADVNHLIEDPNLWGAEFMEQFTLYLGMRMAPSLKADKNLVQDVRNQWSLFLQASMNMADSESQEAPERESQFQSIRG